MAFDTDAVLDRRLLRRKVTFWRAIAAVVAIVALVAGGVFAANRAGLLPGGQHVARVEINGFIGGDAEMIRMLERIGRNDQVKALVVRIDSPGGTVPGAEALYAAIRGVAARKPTAAVIDGMAASGGYIAAIAADHIVSRETSITGSIGVIAQFPNVSRLLDTIGVRVDTLRSTPLKAQPSGVEPISPEATAALREMLTDSYDWFKGLVRERRGLNEAELAAAADGRVFSGARAKGMKLVDVIGGEAEARTFLDGRGASRDLPIRTYKPPRETTLPFARVAAATLAETLGLEGIAESLRRSSLAMQIERAALDGLLAVWQPPTP